MPTHRAHSPEPVLRIWTAEHTALQAWQQSARNGTPPGGPGLVFTREDGSAINPDGWSGTFTRYCREAGLPVIRLHDLRHTHATLLLAAGVNPKVTSERLGHHSTAFTLDVYAHVVPGMQQQAAQAISDLVLGTGSSGAIDDLEEPVADPDLDRS